MTDISAKNLDSHYTTQAKVKPPKYTVAEAPAVLPKYHAFDDIDANNRIDEINTDIYEGVHSEQAGFIKKFWKGYLCFAGAILAFVGARRLFK